jgi:hypothetical protein
VDTSEKRTGELAWFKSSYSAGDGGECVELTICPQAVYVRDSKDTARPELVIGSGAWAAFLDFATL